MILLRQTKEIKWYITLNEYSVVIKLFVASSNWISDYNLKWDVPSKEYYG